MQMTLYWNSLDAFLAMGGYGFYVWGSYLVTAAGLAIEVALLVARRRQTLQTLARMHGVENQ
jgi:heme exporter protein D